MMTATEASVAARVAVLCTGCRTIERAEPARALPMVRPLPPAGCVPAGAFGPWALAHTLRPPGPRAPAHPGPPGSRAVPNPPPGPPTDPPGACGPVNPP